MNDYAWIPFIAAHLPQINKIADQIHTLYERPEIFQEKLNLYPQGCKTLICNNVICGYGISHPWLLEKIPSLDTFLIQLPHKSNCLYIHDVVITPEHRGNNLTVEYLKQITYLAIQHNLAHLALTSVYDTNKYWNKQGFTNHHTAEDVLLAYGPTAQYMTKFLLTDLPSLPHDPNEIHTANQSGINNGDAGFWGHC